MPFFMLIKRQNFHIPFILKTQCWIKIRYFFEGFSQHFSDHIFNSWEKIPDQSVFRRPYHEFNFHITLVLPRFCLMKALYNLKTFSHSLMEFFIMQFMQMILIKMSCAGQSHLIGCATDKNSTRI